MFQLFQCPVGYFLVSSAGDLEIRTCNTSSLLGIVNITRYSQQIHRVKSRGVKFGYLGGHARDPLLSDNFSWAVGVKAFEGSLKETGGVASFWNSASGLMSSSCVIISYLSMPWYWNTLMWIPQKKYVNYFAAIVVENTHFNCTIVLRYAFMNRMFLSSHQYIF